MTLKELRRKTTELLQEGGIVSAETEAVMLLMHVLGFDKTQVLTKEMTITDAVVISVRALANRRLHGEPIQYIIGETEFMSLKFWVNPNVLIPRPETELLVETVMEQFRGQKAEILDVGCGSGCIGISLAVYLHEVHVTGIDVSEEALKIAKRNAERNRVEKRAHFLQHDIFNGFSKFSDPVDCVVSNPPYIRTEEILHIQREVSDYEPLRALDGGADGLKFYRVIASNAPLVTGGCLALEIGYDQGMDVRKILEENGYTEVRVLRDLEHRDRVVIGKKP